jgi:hypothetical protein
MRASLCLALALTACSDGHSYVVVQLDNQGPTLVVQSLDVVASNGGMTATSSIAPGTLFTVPPAQTFALQVDGRSGRIDVDVTAIGNAGPVGHAADGVDIVPGGTARLDLSLMAADDGGVLTCLDHVRDGDESDVDCGGSCPTRCPVGGACASNNDCDSNVCNPLKSTCAPARCGDKIHDGDESDIDCGGLACAPCQPDKACMAPSDCITESCIAGLCTPASAPPNWLPVPVQGVPQTSSFSGALSTDGKVWFVTRFYTAAGGFLSAPVYIYDPVTNMLTSIGKLGQTRQDVGVAFAANGEFFVMGGQFNNVDKKYVETIAGSTFGTPPDLAATRSALAGATGKDLRVYAIGGTSGANVEAFSLFTSMWTTAGTITPRVFLAATTATDGTIYAIGGRSPSGTVLKTTEVYNGDAQPWKVLADMETQRQYHSVTEGSDGRIYAAGGFDGAMLLSSVEAFSPSTNRWTSAASLNATRALFVVVTLPDGRMLAIGDSDNVEIYGPAVTLAPASGAAGSGAAVTGGNFGAHARVAVRFDDAARTLIGAGTTDNAGALTAPIPVIIPSAGVGVHSLTVVDDHSQYPVRLTFTITP